VLLFDFAGVFDAWTPIGDVIMGGISESSFLPSAEGCALFTGRLTPGPSGGFASVRSPLLSFDVTGFAGLSITLRGDGRRYKLSLRTEEAFDAIQFQASVEPPRDRWEVMRVSFERFLPAFRGRTLTGGASFGRGILRSVGFVHSEGQEGPFCLGIRRIEAYK
jgi:hypothetical protein